MRTRLLSSFLSVGLLVAAPNVDAGIIRVDAVDFVGGAGLITFSELPLGTVNPTYAPVDYGGIAGISPTVSFDGWFIGQSLSGTPAVDCPGAASTGCVVGSPSGPLTFDTASPDTFTTTDGAAPNSPVLSGTPRFNGPVAVLFDRDLAGVGFDGGFFDASNSTGITAFARDGSALGTVTNNGLGIEFLGLVTDNALPQIAGVFLDLKGNEPAGFAIDSLRFGSSGQVIGALPPFVQNPSTKPQIDPDSDPTTPISQINLSIRSGLHLLNRAAPDPTLPTIVITHGWQPGGNWSSVISGGAISDQPLGQIKQAVLTRLAAESIDANVFGYNWKDAYTPAAFLNPGIIGNLPSIIGEFTGMGLAGTGLCLGEACDAYLMTAANGHQLALELKKALEPAGEKYTQPVHLIGHSFGTLVNAYAINDLDSLGILEVTQATILDSPLISTVIDARDLQRLMPVGSVSYVDNYYGLVSTLGAGGPILGAAPTLPLGGRLLPLPHTDLGPVLGVPSYYANIVDQSGLGSADTWASPILTTDFVNRPAPQNWAPLSGFQLIRRVSSNVGTAVGSLISHTGNVIQSTFKSVDPLSQIAAALLTETSPSVASLDVTIPIGADFFVIDLAFLNTGDGDWFTVHFDEQLLLSALGQSFLENAIYTENIPVSWLAGNAGTMWFSLNSNGAPNAQMLLGNFRFVGSPTIVAVSEPASLSLFNLGLVGFGLLVWCRKKYSVTGTNGVT